MRKAILYGSILAAMTFFLKLIEYKFVLRDLSVGVYIAIIAMIFTVIGVWGGKKLTSIKKVVVNVQHPAFTADQRQLTSLGISRRELQVLELIAAGLSNQQIADRLAVSLNTIKTQTSSLFSKLAVRRRTQAIQKAKALNLIP